MLTSTGKTNWYLVGFYSLFSIALMFQIVVSSMTINRLIKINKKEKEQVKAAD